MGRHDIPLKYRAVMKGLEKLGLSIQNASNHQTALHEKTGRKTTIPRHKELNKYIVGSIIEFLIECEESEKDIYKAFGIKK